MIGGGRRSHFGPAAPFIIALCVLGSVSPARGDDPKDKKQEKDSVESQTKIFLDTSAKREDRERALDNALALARNSKTPSHAQKFKPALISLISGDLKTRTKDKLWSGFCAKALSGMMIYDAPDPDISRLAEPYLALAMPDNIKVDAVRSLGKFGTAGMLKHLLAIVADYKVEEPKDDGTPKPPPPPGGGEKHAEGLLELLVEVGTCDLTPTGEALQLLVAIVKQNNFPGARHAACRALGEFATHRNVAEVRVPDLQAALLPYCGPEEEDGILACCAAEALWRFGNPEGFNKLIARLDDKRKARDAYISLCSACHAPQGFNNVPPGRWGEFDPQTKFGAITQLKAAWTKIATRNADDTLLDAIAAAGISVPKDRSKENKEVITALIEGLTLDAADLRYGCLDVLAKRIPSRKDAVRIFKTLRESGSGGGKTVMITQEEPPGGFQNQRQREILRNQQNDRVKEWREWWSTFQTKATCGADGVWTAK